MKRRLSGTNLSLENNLPTFRLNAPAVIRVKVKEVRTNVAIYSHALLRIHVIGGQRLVRIVLIRQNQIMQWINTLKHLLNSLQESTTCTLSDNTILLLHKIWVGVQRKTSWDGCPFLPTCLSNGQLMIMTRSVA